MTRPERPPSWPLPPVPPTPSPPSPPPVPWPPPRPEPEPSPWSPGQAPAVPGSGLVLELADRLLGQRIVLLSGTLDASAATAAVAGLAVAGAAARGPAHPNASLVLREPRTSATGRADELLSAGEQHARQVAELSARIAGATGRTREEVAADL